MEMEANKETDKQLDYEEEFIFLDLEDCVYSDIPPNAPFELSGLDTLSPILRIGDNLKLIANIKILLAQATFSLKVMLHQMKDAPWPEPCSIQASETHCKSSKNPQIQSLC